MNVILNKIRKIANQTTANDFIDLMHPNVKQFDNIWAELTLKNIELNDLEIEDELHKLEVFYIHNMEIDRGIKLNTSGFHSAKYDKDKCEIKITVLKNLLRAFCGFQEDISLNQLENIYSLLPILSGFSEKGQE